MRRASFLSSTQTGSVVTSSASLDPCVRDYVPCTFSEYNMLYAYYPILSNRLDELTQEYVLKFLRHSKRESGWDGVYLFPARHMFLKRPKEPGLRSLHAYFVKSLFAAVDRLEMSITLESERLSVRCERQPCPVHQESASAYQVNADSSVFKHDMMEEFLVFSPKKFPDPRKFRFFGRTAPYRILRKAWKQAKSF